MLRLTHAGRSACGTRAAWRGACALRVAWPTVAAASAPRRPLQHALPRSHPFSSAAAAAEQASPAPDNSAGAKAARAQAKRDALAEYKAARKARKKAQYELAIAQPLLTNPRELRLSLVDVPNYKQVKKRWNKGLVVSDKMDKSVAVLVERWSEAWDGKRDKLHTKFICHDENECCKEGDIVYIADSRPLSKTKHKVVQFNAGNPIELRDVDPHDPEVIARTEAAAEEAKVRYEQYMAVQAAKAAEPRHKRILKRLRRRVLGY